MDNTSPLPPSVQKIVQIFIKVINHSWHDKFNRYLCNKHIEYIFDDLNTAVSLHSVDNVCFFSEHFKLKYMAMSYKLHH